MQLTVHRFIFTDKSTISSVDIDGVFFCYGLEPPTRTDEVKPRAVPCGKFPLTIRESARHGKPYPHVEDVPGFDGIEIDIGNYPSDTKGCLLVGREKGRDAVWVSEPVWTELFAKLQACTEPMWIEYIEEKGG